MPKSGQTHALSSRYYRTAMQAALSALKRGDKINAERLALRAASLGPEAEAPWLVLASLVGPEESLAYARKALQLNPESIRAQQAVEWALGRLNAPPLAGEAERPHPLVSMIETMPEIAQPPEPEPGQPPEPFDILPVMIEDLPAAPLLEPEPEPLPELLQPPVSTIENLPEAAQPPGPESRQPSEPLSPPVSAVAPELESPSERRSPLDSLPSWIDVSALPHAREPEPIQPPASAVETSPSVVQPVAPKPVKPVEKPPEPRQPIEESQPPVSAAEPVKTRPFYEEPELPPEQIDLEAIITRPVKPPPIVTRPPVPVKGQKETLPFSVRLLRYALFILLVAALMTVLMFLLPQLTDLWTLFFPGK